MGIGVGGGGMATRSTIIEEWTERAIFGNTALRPSEAVARQRDSGSLRSIENWFDRHCRYRLPSFSLSLSLFGLLLLCRSVQIIALHWGGRKSLP